MSFSLYTLPSPLVEVRLRSRVDTNGSFSIGRRKVFGLAYLGLFLSFAYGPLILWFDKAPTVWVLLFGSFFMLIGGGVPIATNSLNAMAVDISPDGDT